MRKHVTAFAALLLLALWAQLASAGDFWHAGDQKLRRSASSVSCPAEDGWVKLTKAEHVALVGVPPQYLKPNGPKPAEMTEQEKAEVDAAIVSKNALAQVIGLVGRIDGLGDYRTLLLDTRALLVSAGKKVGEIDILIAAADALIADAEQKLTTAIGNLP